MSFKSAADVGAAPPKSRSASAGTSTKSNSRLASVEAGTVVTCDAGASPQAGKPNQGTTIAIQHAIVNRRRGQTIVRFLARCTGSGNER